MSLIMPIKNLKNQFPVIRMETKGVAPVTAILGFLGFCRTSRPGSSNMSIQRLRCLVRPRTNGKYLSRRNYRRDKLFVSNVCYKYI